jgi:hypothetical protein
MKTGKIIFNAVSSLNDLEKIAKENSYRIREFKK